MNSPEKRVFLVVGATVGVSSLVYLRVLPTLFEKLKDSDSESEDLPTWNRSISIFNLILMFIYFTYCASTCKSVTAVITKNSRPWTVLKALVVVSVYCFHFGLWVSTANYFKCARFDNCDSLLSSQFLLLLKLVGKHVTFKAYVIELLLQLPLIILTSLSWALFYWIEVCKLHLLHRNGFQDDENQCTRNKSVIPDNNVEPPAEENQNVVIPQDNTIENLNSLDSQNSNNVIEEPRIERQDYLENVIEVLEPTGNPLQNIRASNCPLHSGGNLVTPNEDNIEAYVESQSPLNNNQTSEQADEGHPLVNDVNNPESCDEQRFPLNNPESPDLCVEEQPNSVEELTTEEQLPLNYEGHPEYRNPRNVTFRDPPVSASYAINTPETTSHGRRGRRPRSSVPSTPDSERRRSHRLAKQGK